MSANYITQAKWNKNLIDVQLTNTQGIAGSYKGLAQFGVLIVTGAPDTTANVYLPSCIIQNSFDKTVYIMNGTSASPSWTLLPTAEAFTIPNASTDSVTTTGTSFALTMSALTTGIAQKITAALVTTGAIFEAIATAATLTTGRYFKANDGALDVWGIGANGHIHSNQTTAPTIAVGTANGITAAAVTAGSTDTAGTITTTGTNNNAGDSLLVVTFNKTYTIAPKAIHVFGTNVSGAKSQVFTSTITATAFTVDIPASASAGATPSFSYIVIA